MNIRKNILYKRTSCFLLLCTILLLSCGGSDSDPTPSGLSAFTITVDPTETHQQMIGFGGALTWYSNWFTSSSQKNTIADLLFTDLGIDIIRFKSWYYPDDYPTTTSTAIMNDDNSKLHWDATNELYTLAKNRNPNVKILLSSWGPPAALKSNNSSRQGTLKKDGGQFMYDAYADYWEHTLDNLPFNPDYLSIQNEPTYTNAGWTTCQWLESETADRPDYMLAFDKVYDKIKNRANPPVMIGPESQDIPTFTAFANKLKDKAHCGVLAYHPYNINSTTTEAQSIGSLQAIGNFTTKPNLMTEFSDNGFTWFTTAAFIQNSLLYANSSGYIYWKLMWATPTTGTDAGMVSINNAGTQYTVTPFYHVIKHFAKHIDAGYQRVEASTSNVNLSVSAFKNPAGTKLTVILLNKAAGQIKVNFAATGKTISSVSANQSKNALYFLEVQNLPTDGTMFLPAQSITTVVLNIN